MKLKQLKTMLKKWKTEKNLALAYDVCDFLCANLDLEDQQ